MKWKRDNASSETEKCIKIVSDINLDVAPGIIIKKLEITFPKPKPVNLKQILQLKHNKEDFNTKKSRLENSQNEREH
jgi:hypothetical protein